MKKVVAKVLLWFPFKTGIVSTRSKHDSLDARAERALARLIKNYPGLMDSSRKKMVLLTEEDRQAVRLIHAARKRAKDNNLPCTIQLSDVRIPTHCPVLGIPLERGDGVVWDNSPTLDRLDPSKGYVPGNVAVMSMRANRIKTNATADEIIAVGNWLRKALAK